MKETVEGLNGARMAMRDLRLMKNGAVGRDELLKVMEAIIINAEHRIILLEQQLDAIQNRSDIKLGL